MVHNFITWELFSLSVTTFFSVPIVYAALTFLNTRPLNSITTITDGAAHETSRLEDLPPGAIPPIADIDLAIVNRKLFLNVNTRGDARGL